MSSYKFRCSVIAGIAVLFFTFTGTKSGFAQNINEEVTVIGAFEPRVPDANKINIDPPQGDNSISVPKMTYNNKPVQLLVNLEPERIAPVKLVGEPLKKLYRNYARVGFGSYTTPLLEFYANSLRSESYSLGVHLKHLSSTGKIEDHPLTDNSLNMVNLYGSKYFGNHTLSGDLGYRRNVVHHYGFKLSDYDADTNEVPSFIFTDDQLKQRFNRYSGAISLQSNYKEENKLNHFVKLGFKHVNDLFETSESNISVNAGADKLFELFEFTDNQQLGLITNVDHTIYKDSLLTNNSTLITLQPYIGASFNEYSLKVGFTANFKLDSISKAYLYPFAEGQLRIIKDALVFRIGITGGIKRQSFDELSDVNPFVQSILPLQYTNEKFTLYANLNARAGSHLDFSAVFRSSNVENAAFFVNDYSVIPYNRFTLEHDNGKLLEGRLEAKFHSSEDIVIMAYAGLESWSLDTLQNPWHTPSLKYGLNTVYQYQNMLIFRANVAAAGEQFALALDETGQRVSKSLEGYADISLGAEYRYTKTLSAFINFNNITNSRYYTWNNYPSYRFNVMGGITYSF